ncbi:YggT family protein [Agromyces bracchium]|uniref:YggT family protein n=1 Tax=Agromyces bracchium TaxID=88376 RepID=A0A6I3M862_9MICO|nr:YggT family protein [Agromyces bracchium]
MSALAVVWNLVYTLLLIYFFVMWARFVLDLVRTFNRSWRPRGFVLVLVEAVYTVTDPLVRFFRRLIPPIRLGQVALDLGWSVAMLVVIIAMTVVSWLAAGAAAAA